MKRRIKLYQPILIVFCLFTVLWSGQMMSIAQTAFDCSAVTEIPLAECEALVVIANANPNNEFEWLQSTRPCDWDGISCTSLPPQTVSSLSLQRPFGEDDATIVIPAEIANLTQLRSISLENWGLTTIPDPVINHPTIEQLSMGGNPLVNKFEALAKLANMASLIDLDLGGAGSNVKMRSIPPEITNLTQLEILWLSFNDIPAVPAEIGNMTKLKTLVLNDNRIPSLPVEISNLTEIGFITFDGNPLVTWPITILNISPITLYVDDLCRPVEPQFEAWLDTINNVVGDFDSTPCSLTDIVVPPLTVTTTIQEANVNQTTLFVVGMMTLLFTIVTVSVRKIYSSL